VHLDGHDLRLCAIEARKALLKDVVGEMNAPRMLFVEGICGGGARLFERVQAVGAEGIVSKRLGSQYRPGRSADWLKTKVSMTGEFIITGFVEIGVGRLEALAVAEERAHGDLVPAGQVGFGLAGRGLWQAPI
jgi:bifunctional non-homologous end joining protein LigD